jgi:hypothetical protein
MNEFSTFTVPCGASFHVYASTTLSQEICPELSSPRVEQIPDAFMFSLIKIQLDRNIDSEAAWHYASHLIDEQLAKGQAA